MTDQLMETSTSGIGVAFANVTDIFAVNNTIVIDVGHGTESENNQQGRHVSVVAVIVGLLCVLMFSIAVRVGINFVRKRRDSSRRERACALVEDNAVHATSGSDPDGTVQLYVNIPTPEVCHVTNAVRHSVAERPEPTYDNWPEEMTEASDGRTTKPAKITESDKYYVNNERKLAVSERSSHQPDWDARVTEKRGENGCQSTARKTDPVYTSLVESVDGENLYQSYQSETPLYENV